MEALCRSLVGCRNQAVYHQLGRIFIEEECTDEKLYYLGEDFDDIMDKSRSVEFLNCLRRRAQRVENAEWKADILEDIRTAAEYIDE